MVAAVATTTFVVPAQLTLIPAKGPEASPPEKESERAKVYFFFLLPAFLAGALLFFTAFLLADLDFAAMMFFFRLLVSSPAELLVSPQGALP